MKWSELVPEDGDAFIVLRNNGQAGEGWVRHGDNALRLPLDIEVSYVGDGEKPRQFVVRAGWTKRQWDEHTKQGRVVAA